MAAMSIKVVCGVGSTSRSRSLSSVSTPCSTEPNTRRLWTRCRAAISRSVERWASKASDGRKEGLLAFTLSLCVDVGLDLGGERIVRKHARGGQIGVVLHWRPRWAVHLGPCISHTSEQLSQESRELPWRQLLDGA